MKYKVIEISGGFYNLYRHIEPVDVDFVEDQLEYLIDGQKQYWELIKEGDRGLAARSELQQDADKLNKKYDKKIDERLEHLRREIRAERISYGEIAELQSLVEHIAPGDVELLEWVGVPEQS